MGWKESVSVAVFDSLYDPGSILENPEKFKWVDSEDYVNSSLADTTGHGLGVWLLLAYFAPGAEFYLYRVADRGGWIQESDYLRALGKAHFEDEIDVLNISAGIPHPDCTQDDPCTVCLRSREAIEDGVTIVAAAGNGVEQVCCPAKTNRVVSVGGFVSKCGSIGENVSPIDENIDPPSGAYFSPTIDESDLDNPLKATGLYCGQEGCDGNEKCTNRRDEPWDGGVQSPNGNIDILAPVISPNVDNNGDVSLVAGTSYATPIVSGVVASALSNFRSVTRVPSPVKIQSAICATGKPLDGTSVPRLHGTKLLAKLAQELDVSIKRT